MLFKPKKILTIATKKEKKKIIKQLVNEIKIIGISDNYKLLINNYTKSMPDDIRKIIDNSIVLELKLGMNSKIVLQDGLEILITLGVKEEYHIIQNGKQIY